VARILHLTKSRQAPVDGADTGNILRRADTFSQQTVTNFPREHSGIFLLVSCYGVDDWRRSYFRFRSADDARLDRPCVVEPAAAQLQASVFTRDSIAAAAMGGAENAGVENAGAIIYGKPSE